MKTKGAVLFEVMISLTLLSLVLFPLLKYTNQLFLLKIHNTEVEEAYSNFLALKKQYRMKELDELKSSKGEYNDIIFPYPIAENTKIEVNIFNTDVFTEVDKFKYISCSIVYTINNKEFRSCEILRRVGE